MAREVEERFMQARHLAQEGKELNVSQTSVQEKKAGLFVELAMKNLQNLSVESYRVYSRQKRKKMNFY